MDIDAHNLEAMFKGFNTIFNRAHEAAPKHYDKVVTTVRSIGSDETYGWLKNLPRIREWLGERIVRRLEREGYTIRNAMFEATVSVPRTNIEDDKLGMYEPIMSEMGHNAASHPDELVFDLLSRGFTEECFDGQPFFDADHPVRDANGVEQSVSNMQVGAEDPWFLLDTTRAVRPLVWQERIPYKLTSLTQEGDTNVFMKDEYLYGVRARVNAGFGLWQLAFGSKALLNSANYGAARASMMNVRADEGRVMGVNPTLLVVPPSLEEKARNLLTSAELTGGGSNPWAGSAELLVTPFVALN